MCWLMYVKLLVDKRVAERLVELIITSLYSAFGDNVVAVGRSGAFEVET